EHLWFKGTRLESYRYRAFGVRDRELLLDLVAGKGLDTACLQTHRGSFKRYEEAVELLKSQRAIKVCFYPGQDFDWKKGAGHASPSGCLQRKAASEDGGGAGSGAEQRSSADRRRLFVDQHRYGIVFFATGAHIRRGRVSGRRSVSLPSCTGLSKNRHRA